MYEAITAEPYDLSKAFRQTVVKQGKDSAIKWMQSQKGVAIKIDVPPEKEDGNLVGTISRCLQINPANRFQDLAHLKAELLIDCE